MAFLRTGSVLASALLLVCTANAARPHHKASAAKSGKHARTHHASFAHPAGIGSARATEIQTALIREHYMGGSPSGVWDDASKDAMARYQAANGIPTRVTPDSRALIKLGLGPDQTGAAPVQAAETSSPAAATTGGSATFTTSSATRNTLGSAIAAQQNFMQ